jgi:hypothetical protein
VPNREDLFRAHGGGYNAQKRLFDDVRPGEVIVMDAAARPARAPSATSSPCARSNAGRRAS